MEPKQYDPKTMSWDDIRDVLAANSLQLQEARQQMLEADKKLRLQMQETDRKIKELTTQFTSQSGHIIEGLMEPSVVKMFQQTGYDIESCWKNYKRYNKATKRKFEVDLMLLDHDIAIIVEVKINCTCKNIDHFIDQMHSFKENCPEYAGKRILLAVASVNYERDADVYAHERGLFVIRVSNDNIFSLDSNDGDEMMVL